MQWHCCVGHVQNSRSLVSYTMKGFQGKRSSWFPLEAYATVASNHLCIKIVRQLHTRVKIKALQVSTLS